MVVFLLSLRLCRNRRGGLFSFPQPSALRPSRFQTNGSVFAYTLNELPQPQVFFTFGLLNLKPAPSRVST